MLRAKKLGNVEFNHNTLFIEEEFIPANVEGEEIPSAAGTYIYYAATIETPHITLDGRSYGWVTDEQRIELISMWASLGTLYLLTYNDDSTNTVIMRPDKAPEFKEIYEGACRYNAKIYLTKEV